MKLVVWLSWLAMAVGAEYVKYKDPKQPVAARIKDLMYKMTLAEKIGQMAQIDRSVATEQILRDYSVGNNNFHHFYFYFSSFVLVLVTVLAMIFILFFLWVLIIVC